MFYFKFWQVKAIVTMVGDASVRNDKARPRLPLGCPASSYAFLAQKYTSTVGVKKVLPLLVYIH